MRDPLERTFTLVVFGMHTKAPWQLRNFSKPKCLKCVGWRLRARTSLRSRPSEKLPPHPQQKAGASIDRVETLTPRRSNRHNKTLLSGAQSSCPTRSVLVSKYHPLDTTLIRFSCSRLAQARFARAELRRLSAWVHFC
jgi:hypothetical protein